MSDQDYALLVISRADATPQTVRRAYHKMAIKWHPDKNLDCPDLALRMMRAINGARDNILDAFLNPPVTRADPVPPPATVSVRTRPSSPTRQTIAQFHASIAHSVRVAKTKCKLSEINAHYLVTLKLALVDIARFKTPSQVARTISREMLSHMCAVWCGYVHVVNPNTQHVNSLYDRDFFIGMLTNANIPRNAECAREYLTARLRQLKFGPKPLQNQMKTVLDEIATITAALQT